MFHNTILVSRKGYDSMASILIWIPAIVAAVSAVSCIVTFMNVNRTQKANLENDEKRFLRDVTLKASDEYIEVLSKTREAIDIALEIKEIYKKIIRDPHANIQLLTLHINTSIVKLMQSKDTLISTYEKRRLILQEYEGDHDRLKGLLRKTIKGLENYGAENKPGTADQQIEIYIEYNILESGVEGLNIATQLMGKLQENFLGKIYKKELLLSPFISRIQ